MKSSDEVASGIAEQDIQISRYQAHRFLNDLPQLESGTKATTIIYGQKKLHKSYFGLSA